MEQCGGQCHALEAADVTVCGGQGRALEATDETIGVSLSECGEWNSVGVGFVRNSGWNSGCVSVVLWKEQWGCHSLKAKD